MSKLLVVVGATGHQGRSVVSYFQRTEPSWKIRGLTRNPSSETATALSKSGVEVVKADLNDLSSLKKAFSGANYIFAYTDFAGIIGSPEVMGKFKAGQLAPPIGAECFKIEVQHGRNIADAAAEVPELERLIWSALAGIKKISKGKYTEAYHFDAKAAVTEYMLGKKELTGKVSTVQMGSFANNVSKGLDLFNFKILDDKTALWKPPFKDETSLPWIDVEKDTGAYVKALIEAPAPTQILGVRVPSRFEAADPAHLNADNDPTGLTRGFLQTAQFMADFGFTGGDPDVVMPEDLEKRGIKVPRTPIADYIMREDWSKLLSGAA